MNKIIPFILNLLLIFNLKPNEPKNYVVSPKINLEKTLEKKIIQVDFDSSQRFSKIIIKKKDIEANSWFKIDILPKGSYKYYDTLDNSEIKEYGFILSNDSISSYGYYLIGDRKNSPPYQGNVLLLIDSTIAPLIQDELALFMSDLQNDGWYSEYRKVPRADYFNPLEIRKVKRIVNSYKNKWKNDFKVLLLIGKVPVPYTGNTSLDGHSDHYGAFPSDLFYVVDDSLLTDHTEYNISAEREVNWNVPFDGKYDQTTIPKEISIAVGRIDFSNLTYFKESESELLKNYLNKNHAFRKGQIQANFNGLIDDGFGVLSSEIFSANAWMNFKTLCDTIIEGKFLEKVTQKYFRFAYACNSGSYTSVWSSINSEECAKYNILSTFVILFGSYFWDWDTKDNLLRSILASSPNTLISIWSGRPFWHLHHFAFGYPLAWSFVVSANNSNLYESTGKYGYRGMHLELLGDPTLRMYYPKPITNLEITSNENKIIRLFWNIPETSENLVGYQILRKSKHENHFKLINILPSDITTYNDTLNTSGTFQYQVRALFFKETNFGEVIFPSLGVTKQINID